MTKACKYLKYYTFYAIVNTNMNTLLKRDLR